MNHFVRHHPVLLEFLRRGLDADRDPNQSAVVQAKSMPVVSSPTVEAADVEISVPKWEASVIGNDGIRGVVDPGHQVVLGGLRKVGGEVYVNRAAANFERRITMRGESNAKHKEKCKDRSDEHAELT